ncbi:hypothetical protein GOV12_05525 [Candidatus Pacearchaeota archaeon]|nr:hypothetical protein [Candidatus Pacearchaeota archaeon]
MENKDNNATFRTEDDLLIIDISLDEKTQKDMDDIIFGRKKENLLVS